MTSGEHPIERLLVNFPRIQRVRDFHAVASDSDGRIPVFVILPMLQDGERRVVTIDMYLQFVGSRVRLELTRALVGNSAATEMVRALMTRAHGGLCSRYTVGLERCTCRESVGGPRWSPVCVALWSEGQSIESRTRLAMLWWELVQERPEEFCGASIAGLRRNGFL